MDVWLDAMRCHLYTHQSRTCDLCKVAAKTLSPLVWLHHHKRMARKAVDQYCGNIE